MSRTARAVSPGAPHHLILRGNNRRRLFSYPREYRLFLALLERAARQTGCKVHVLCLMSNHVHLLVTPPDRDLLSAFVKRVAQRYAQVRNGSRDASGKLFEERFKSEPVLSDRQLAIETAYIELNPVRAGIVRNAVDYPWSSARLHALRDSPCVSKTLWTPSSWYEALGDDELERAQRHSEWLAEYERAKVGGATVQDEDDECDWEPLAHDPPAADDGRRIERPDRKRAI